MIILLLRSHRASVIAKSKTRAVSTGPTRYLTLRLEIAGQANLAGDWHGQIASPEE
jgi:hypothetical protein